MKLQQLSHTLGLSVVGAVRSFVLQKINELAV